jgi:fumarylpyruvate hydrolase
VPAAKAQVGPDTLIELEVNGAVRQTSRIGKLIWSIPEVIEHLSAGWALQPGDLIYTGSPAGVGAVVKGDVMEGEIAGLGTLKVAVG